MGKATIATLVKEINAPINILPNPAIGCKFKQIMQPSFSARTSYRMAAC